MKKHIRVSPSESKDCLAGREWKERNPNNPKDYMWIARFLGSLVTGGRVVFRSRTSSVRPLTKSSQSYSWLQWWFNPITLSFTSCIMHYNGAKGRTCKTRSLLSEPTQANEHFWSSIPPLVLDIHCLHGIYRYCHRMWDWVLWCLFPIKHFCAKQYSWSPAEGIQAIHSLSTLNFGFG